MVIMQPRTKYEKEILREISTLPEYLQNKLSRIIIFIKNEMNWSIVLTAKYNNHFINLWPKSKCLFRSNNSFNSDHKSSSSHICFRFFHFIIVVGSVFLVSSGKITFTLLRALLYCWKNSLCSFFKSAISLQLTSFQHVSVI